jgi:CDGSH-type Zn-finger protein
VDLRIGPIRRVAQSCPVGRHPAIDPDPDGSHLGVRSSRIVAGLLVALVLRSPTGPGSAGRQRPISPSDGDRYMGSIESPIAQFFRELRSLVEIRWTALADDDCIGPSLPLGRRSTRASLLGPQVKKSAGTLSDSCAGLQRSGGTFPADGRIDHQYRTRFLGRIDQSSRTPYTHGTHRRSIDPGNQTPSRLADSTRGPSDRGAFGALSEWRSILPATPCGWM